MIEGLVEGRGAQDPLAESAVHHPGVTAQGREAVSAKIPQGRIVSLKDRVACAAQS